MPDVIETTSTALSNAYLVDMADLVKADLEGSANLMLRLFTNNITPDRETPLNNFTEAVGGGYAPVNITSFNGPYMDAFGNAYIVSDLQIFTCDGTATNGMVGSYLTRDTGGDAATATATGTGGVYDPIVTVTDGGGPYTTAPTVRFTGADGSGAAGYAEISGGEVVAVHITNRGTGYSTYLITIDPPQELVAAGRFPATVNMSSPTDALPTTQDIVIPPINA